VDVERDVLLWVLGFEEQHLGDDQAGDVVVHRTAQKDDVVLEQARVDVIGALAPVRLLHNHRNQHASQSPSYASSTAAGPASSPSRWRIVLSRRSCARKLPSRPSSSSARRRAGVDVFWARATIASARSNSSSVTWIDSASEMASRSRRACTRRSASGSISPATPFQSMFALSRSTPRRASPSA